MKISSHKSLGYELCNKQSVENVKLSRHFNLFFFFGGCGVCNVVFRSPRLLGFFKSDVSVSCWETILELMTAFLSPPVLQLPLLTSLKIDSVQETETSDLNQNNNLDARNTTLQNVRRTTFAKPGFKPFTECFICIIV